jgi:DNA-binding beta-propeller fold protein YncE
MPKNYLVAVATFLIVLPAAGSNTSFVNRAHAAGASSELVPVFEVDSAWPQLPNNWVLSNVAKVAVDKHDNVWIIHRPRTVPAGKIAAPPVVELDSSGKLIRAWGDENATNYDWPDAEHNVYVDQNDNVYISGSSPSGQSKTMRSDDMILKFTVDGKFLKEFGGRTTSKGSLDPTSVNKPGDLYVWPKTNELFIADGYGNRRVLVLDADTFSFKRLWGAFGKPPVDDANSGGPGASGGPARQPGQAAAGATNVPKALDADGHGPDQFASPVHGVLVSNDGIVYVADRANRRVQLFTPDGKYLSQMFLNRAGPSSDSVSGLAFSPDPEQKYLYLSDFGNSHIAVLDRKSMTVLYQFGTRGKEPGNFQGVHHIAVDSKGNLYTAEVAPGARAQKFVYKGLSAALPPNALTPDQLAAEPPARGG